MKYFKKQQIDTNQKTDLINLLGILDVLITQYKQTQGPLSLTECCVLMTNRHLVPRLTGSWPCNGVADHTALAKKTPNHKDCTTVK